jgi:ribosomal protein L11
VTTGAYGPVDPRYAAARRVLLDALQALAPHGPAIVLVGAQAIYLRTGMGEIGVAPYTTDGDLALDPTLLGDEPELEAAMTAAGFRLHEPQLDHPTPGMWVTPATVEGEELLVPVDLIVPEGAAAPGGRRGARLGPHGRRAARRAAGLEAALVDHAAMKVAALEPDDLRSFDVQVARPAALLVAKTHKIRDRLGSRRPDRADDKDAADVYRLMQTTAPAEIGDRLAALLDDALAGEATRDAIGYLSDLFGRRDGAGVAMAVRALRLAIPEAQVVTLATAYVEALRAQIDEVRP